MYGNRQSRKFFRFCLFLLLCASASAQGAAPLRLTDVAWDMTPEEVMEAEGAAGADTTQAYEGTGAQYVFNYPAEGGEPAAASSMRLSAGS